MSEAKGPMNGSSQFRIWLWGETTIVKRNYFFDILSQCFFLIVIYFVHLLAPRDFKGKIYLTQLLPFWLEVGFSEEWYSPSANANDVCKHQSQNWKIYLPAPWQHALIPSCQCYNCHHPLESLCGISTRLLVVLLGIISGKKNNTRNRNCLEIFIHLFLIVKDTFA